MTDVPPLGEPRAAGNTASSETSTVSARPPAEQKLQEVRQALAVAERRAAEHLDGWKRARADYENLQKRLGAELAAARGEGTRSTLTSLLPLLDQLDAALAAAPHAAAEDPWLSGLRQVHQGLRQTLMTAGIQIIEETGTPFDPHHHEAVATEPSHEPEGTVTALVTPGYRWGDTVLRPAKVRVSTGPQKPAPAGTAAA